MSDDLVKLEELAKAATPGPWWYQKTGDNYTHIVRRGENAFIVQFPQNKIGGKNAMFIAAANPATVLSMVATIRALQEQLKTARNDAGNRKFKLGDRVEKISGSSWRGYVVGFYTTKLTPEGYAVESENEPGSVQIYPVTALRALKVNGESE